MIFQIALLFFISLLFGLICRKLSQPLLLGYIFAGMFLSFIFHPSVETESFLEHLGHFGLLMLIFKIGLEFDLEQFKKVWKKSALLFLIQIVFASVFAFLCRYFFLFNAGLTVLVIFLLILNSAAVSVKLMEAFNQLQTADGSFILSVLILQDLAIVPMLIILSEMKNASISNISLKVGGSVLGLCLLIRYLSDSSNQIFRSLKLIFDGNREIIVLASMSFFFIFACASESVGLAASYGTFLAGLILGSFGIRHDILDVVEPIENLLMMVFFIYVGSLMNIEYVWENLIRVVFFSFVFLIVNLMINYLALRVLRFSRSRSLFFASILTQAAEFSFTFIAIVFGHNLLDQKAVDLLNTLCVISIILGSIFPFVVRRFVKMLETRQRKKLEELQVFDSDASSVALDNSKKQGFLNKLCFWKDDKDNKKS